MTSAAWRSTPDLLPPEKFHCFGDWLSIKADTPKDVIYTAYFAHSAHLASRAAAAVGKDYEAQALEKLFQDIRDAFFRTYVSADGRIKGDTQTCYVLALAFDLVQGEQARLAAQYLVEDIEKRNWHLSTGFIGTKYLMLVLSNIGRPDVAYRLLVFAILRQARHGCLGRCGRAAGQNRPNACRRSRRYFISSLSSSGL